MIYAKLDLASEQGFISLLNTTKIYLLKVLDNKQNVSPLDFEATVAKQMTIAAKGTEFEDTIIQTGAHAFPDIIAKKYFGVEVKMTLSDHWTSTGNSVLESSRLGYVERIYILFGKFGGKFDIKYRLYQECLPEISVTHSPRYRINMSLAHGQSIFDKLRIDYDNLRKDPSAILKIKNYYRSKLKDGEELWWIDQDNDDNAVSPVIKPFRNLSEKEKENFIVECMILFPEMFGNKPTKYERAAAYLIAEYNAVSANLRDHFTAGGKKEIYINGKVILVPQVAFNMYKRARAIRLRINEIDEDTLKFYWRVENVKNRRLEHWKKVMNKQLSRITLKKKASQIFDAGLSEQAI